mgnify:CR=1 FL=1
MKNLRSRLLEVKMCFIQQGCKRAMVAGNPVSIQSPASHRPRTGVRVDGRAGWLGARENVACGSRMTVVLSTAALRTLGNAPVSSSHAVSTSCVLVQRSTSAAPLDTSDMACSYVSDGVTTPCTYDRVRKGQHVLALRAQPYRGALRQVAGRVAQRSSYRDEVISFPELIICPPLHDK